MTTHVWGFEMNDNARTAQELAVKLIALAGGVRMGHAPDTDLLATRMCAIANDIAALASQAEPVAVIGRDWSLLWADADPLATIVRKHGLAIGTLLYARTPPAPAQAEPTRSERMRAAGITRRKTGRSVGGLMRDPEDDAAQAEQSEDPPVDPVQAHAAHCNGCSTCDKWRETLGAPTTAEQSEDGRLLDWIEEQVRSSYTGISFDYARFVEDGCVVEKGVRFMRRGYLGERHESIRAAIRAAIAAKEQS